MPKPDLLFLTPLLPFPTGTGSAMRAAFSVEALSQEFRVHVLNSAVWGWRPGIFDTAWCRENAASYNVVPPQASEKSVGELLLSLYPGVRFAAIHAFRLITARFAVSVQAMLPEKPTCVLDLDDDEAARAERISAIRRAAGDAESAAREMESVPRLRLLERMIASRFGAICLASETDREVWQARHPAQQVLTLPNVVRVPDSLPSRPCSPGAPTLLFVGSMDYLPNSDGCQFFVRDILPLLRQQAGEHVEAMLVGSNPPPQVLQLGRVPGVSVTGSVPRVEPYYRRCDLAIVPLRAGSGTRLKILEAFAQGMPVVSTAIGAEGLQVRDSEQLLIADSAQDFAAACSRVLGDPELADRLRVNAWEWLTANHSPARMADVLRSVYREASGRAAAVASSTQ